uniref:Acetylornithine deacetylase n=1 Tax=Strigomonas oncopelti TaxID=5657 RepID=U5KL79_STROO|nr:acetylornithine deacetylase [Strigomonas oncopelti]
MKSARQWLEELVSYKTISCDSNLDLVEHIAAYLREQQLEVVVDLATDGIHANLLATLPATDGTTDGGVIFCGHTDVVPVGDQQWDSDPFVLTERDGKLYGRGSCDMKGFIAVILALVPEWRRQTRTKAVHIGLTYNEEVNLAGVLQLAREHGAAIGRCEGCIIGEPTMLDLVIAHKGAFSNTLVVTGKSTHASLQTRAFNAVEPANRFIAFLLAMRERFATEGPFDDAFEIPYTTMNPTLVHAGVAMNTIPDKCTVGFDFRNIPSHSALEIQEEIEAYVEAERARVQQVCPEANMELRLGVFKDPRHFAGDPDSSVVQAVRAAAADAQQPVPRLVKALFYTEASVYQGLGTSAVVCGPGSIEVAHQANEYVAVEQLERAVKLFRGAAERLVMAAPSA